MAQRGTDGKTTSAGRRRSSRFPTAQEDRQHAGLDPETPQTSSPAYRLGFADPDFLLRDELRSARLQLEYLKPEILQRDRGITDTVAVFGSARIPAPEDTEAFLEEAQRKAAQAGDDPRATVRQRAAHSLADKARLYEEARHLGRLISESQLDEARPGERRRRRSKAVVVTGGGPGIMEAANRGAHDVGAENVGLNIVLPFEQRPNAYITPHLCFNFHYFAMRKMHFMMRAKALVVFPGGFGTLDELFEALCLIQTGKVEPFPVLLFDRRYWETIINFDALVKHGVIDPADLDIFTYVETAEEAWRILEPVLVGARKRS